MLRTLVTAWHGTVVIDGLVEDNILGGDLGRHKNVL